MQPRRQVQPQDMIQIIVWHVALGFRAQVTTRHVYKVFMHNNFVIVNAIWEVWQLLPNLVFGVRIDDHEPSFSCAK